MRGQSSSSAEEAKQRGPKARGHLQGSSTAIDGDVGAKVEEENVRTYAGAALAELWQTAN